MDKFYIGFNDGNSGIQTNIKPFLINDNAFSSMKNAYVYRGRVRKRFGSQWMGQTQRNSRLRFQVSTADGTGSKLITYPTGITVQAGQVISINDSLFTVVTNNVSDSLLSTNASWIASVTSSNSITLTFNATPPANATPIFVYPSNPVMGLSSYFRPASSELFTMGFDTTFSYRFDDITQAWIRLSVEDSLSVGSSVWTGSDARFFWMINYQGATSDVNLFWVSNNTVADGIRYFDGTSWHKPVLNWTIGANVGITDGSGDVSIDLTARAPFFPGQIVTVGLTSFQFPLLPAASIVNLVRSSNSPGGPVGTATFDTTSKILQVTGAFINTNVYFSGNNYVQTALIIISFKNRLLLLNTVELINGVSTEFKSRLRYSGVGSPLYASSWQQDFPGNGSEIDAPTSEAIVSAQFIKDRLIVFFENSTYEIAYTGNQVLPFVWQKINTELGASSTFSEVPFDKVVLGISNVGIHACNGTGVERIDNKIPQLAFDISTQESGANRVAGIRDFFTEMVYWTYPSSGRSDNFYYPNKVLVYNYVNDAWSINDDSFTTFGYYSLSKDTPGDIWETTNLTWKESNAVWNTNFDATTNPSFKSVIAGNQQGFVVIIKADISDNAYALQVTQAVYSSPNYILDVICINHNVEFEDYLLFSSMNGLVFTDSDGKVSTTAAGRVVTDPVNDNNPNSFSIAFVGNNFQPITISGSYKGGGVIKRISQIDIMTKQYNFYADKDRKITFNKVDFLIDKTDNGAVTVDYFLSSANNISMLEAAAFTGSALGNGTLQTSAYSLVPIEAYQTRLWHPVYLIANGQCIQLRIFLSESQMTSYSVDTNSAGDVVGFSYTALNNFELNAMIFHARPSSYTLT